MKLLLKLLLRYMFCATYISYYYWQGDIGTFANLILFALELFLFDCGMLATQWVLEEMSWTERAQLSELPEEEREREERMDIYSKLARLSVDESTHADFPSDECSVCLEEFKANAALRLTCGHNFHHGCIFRSFEQSPECPLCRKESVLGVILYNISQGVLYNYKVNL